MRIKCDKTELTDYDFLRLLVSSMVLHGQNPIIENHKLEQSLYMFYDRTEYHDLFEDVCKREDTVGKNSYVDLNEAFQSGYAFGLLLQIHDGYGEQRSLINLSMDEAKEMQTEYTTKQVEVIANLSHELVGQKENFSNVVLMKK